MKIFFQTLFLCVTFIFLAAVLAPPLLVAYAPSSQDFTASGSDDQDVPPPATVLTTDYFKKYSNKAIYLNLSNIGNAVVNNLIIGKPPQPNTPAFTADETSRLITYSYATLTDLALAHAATYDLFSFSSVLGSNFTSAQLPKTTALFAEVDADLKLATDAAKKTFRRHHPLRSGGFCYPCDHASIMFLYATLLAEIYPAQAIGLYKHARQLSYYRVMRGGHYPADVVAGESYGIYLAAEFRKNSTFQARWNEAKQEIMALVPPDSL